MAHSPGALTRGRRRVVGGDGLTDRQREILAVIADHTAARGYPPTMREIGRAVGLSSSSSVAHQLNRLQNLGYVEADPQRTRTYRLTRARPTSPPADPVHGSVAVPLVSHSEVGSPTTTMHDADVLHLPRRIVGDGDLIALTVRVGSPAGTPAAEGAVNGGDLVMVRRQPTAEHDDLVAALIDGETTISRYHRDGEQTWLVPHPTARPTVPADRATLIGKVVAVLRTV
ncbi:transcriptional repressor LexA [Kitasatospora sp. NPDC059571]|uniref:transcriptional repressor LexA n=1 Tax=Kitasatospora sp. NPDC059571 TaxID=3346871 RepID=UPI0036BB5B33